MVGCSDAKSSASGVPAVSPTSDAAPSANGEIQRTSEASNDHVTTRSTTAVTLPSTQTQSPSGTTNETENTPDGTTNSPLTGGPATTNNVTSTAPPDPGAGPNLRDGMLFVDGARFRIRGVNWNPVPVGATHPQGLDYAGSVAVDAPLMQAAGINAVRTYEHLDNIDVLNTLYEHGIYVFTTVYGFWRDDPAVVTARVNAVKDHPAVLGYVLGNEWNYNQLYSDPELSPEQTATRIKDVAALVKQADATKLVCTIYGELDGIEGLIETMPDIDMWGINAYRGIGFDGLFEQYAQISNKPMFLGEFGADAYNANIEAYDPESQADATSALLGEISAAFNENKTTGGFIFEWNDEWWKDTVGALDQQDVGGFAPGGGPHPDATFNEEWWGIVDINRNTRPAYDALQVAYLP